VVQGTQTDIWAYLIMVKRHIDLCSCYLTYRDNLFQLNLATQPNARETTLLGNTHIFMGLRVPLLRKTPLL